MLLDDPHPRAAEEQLATYWFRQQLKDSPLTYMLSQIMWLRAYHWDRLSNELSGQLYPHMISSTCNLAAQLLLKLSGGESKRVILPKRYFPIGETTIKFGKFSMAHFPGEAPVFITPDKKITSLEDLAKGNISDPYLRAAEEILTMIEGQ